MYIMWMGALFRQWLRWKYVFSRSLDVFAVLHLQIVCVRMKIRYCLCDLNISIHFLTSIKLLNSLFLNFTSPMHLLTHQHRTYCESLDTVLGCSEWNYCWHCFLEMLKQERNHFSYIWYGIRQSVWNNNFHKIDVGKTLMPPSPAYEE